MNQSVAQVAPRGERIPPRDPRVRETPELAARRDPVAETALRAIHLRGDAWMARFIVFHLVVAVALAPFHGTWSAAAVLGGGAAVAFLCCRLLWPARLVTRIVAGIALQAFVVLHIHQMAGLAEMHFFFFTAVTAMIIYQDWRAPWPGVLAIIAQHTIFHHLHNQGIHPGGLTFFEPEAVGGLRMSFHYGIAIAQVAIASYWAHVLHQQTLREATQKSASTRANALLQEQQVELATANEYLSEQALRLEKTNAELRESEIRFRSTFDQAAVGVAHVGLNGEWLRVNDRLCEITGYSRDELLGLTFQAITHAEDLESDLDRLRRLLDGEIQSYSMEKRYIRKDAAPVWINLTVSLMRDGDGEPAYFVSIIEDIDARRQAEAERDRLYRLEAESRQVAEAANQAKSQFLATMSHELRTPLNAISGYVELLEMGIHGPVNEQQTRSLGRVRSAGQYLLSLINDILNFARIESGRIDIFPVPVSVARLLSDVEPLIAPQMARKGLEMVLQLPGPEIAVHVDPEKAQQILLNLLGNAIKFTPAGGMVRLDARPVGDSVRIRVADNGCGIAEDRLEHIFEPFVQVDRHLTPESQQGIGLGLSISRELARAMGGDLSVESVPGEGSVFSVSFPLGPARRADPLADGQGFIEIPVIARDRQV
jgi:PAS domain S-box-containing protein